MTGSSGRGGHGTSTLPLAGRRRSALVILGLTLIATLPASAPAQGVLPDGRVERPLTVHEVVEFETLALRSPIRLSPDGRWVAYTVSGAQRSLGSVLELVKDSSRASAGIRVADLETGRVVELTPGANSWSPSWSPDRSTLAFYSTRSGDPRLWIWSPDDGMRPASAAPVWPAYLDQAPRWVDERTVVVKLLPEGRSVGETARRARPAPPGLPGEEGTTVELFRGEGSGVDADAFPEWIRHAYAGDLAAIDLRSGAATRLAPNQLAMWWDVSPDGETLAFSALAGTEEQRAGFTVFAVPTAGGRVRALPGRLVRPFGDGVSWSPAGRRLAYVSRGGVYVVDVAGGERRRVADARNGWGRPAGPVWASDGRSLLFTDGELWRVPLGGESEPERVAAFEDRAIHAVVTGAARVPVRTNRGEWLVRLSDEATGETGFARLDPATGSRSAETLLAGRMGLGRTLAAAPDGSRVVIGYRSASRAPELWLLGSELAPTRQVSRLNPAFDSVALGETRGMTWTTRTGDTVHGTVTLPPEVVRRHAPRGCSVMRARTEPPEVEASMSPATSSTLMLPPDVLP